MGVTFENLERWRTAPAGGRGARRDDGARRGAGRSGLARLSAQVRARGDKGPRAGIVASTDGGKTGWRSSPARRADPGPAPDTSASSAARRRGKALLRFEMTGNNTIGVLSFRVDADYRDPLAARGIPAVPRRPPMEGAWQPEKLIPPADRPAAGEVRDRGRHGSRDGVGLLRDAGPVGSIPFLREGLRSNCAYFGDRSCQQRSGRRDGCGQSARLKWSGPSQTSTALRVGRRRQETMPSVGLLPA